MRNVWLVVKREYLERVRKRSFLISTLLLPAMMFALIVLPGKLATLKTGGERHIVVVASSAEFGEAVKQEILGSAERQASDNSPDHALPASKYKVDIDLKTSEEERLALRARVTAGEIDGYIWASDDAVAEHRITYSARETSDFMETLGLSRAVKQANLKRQLQTRGFSPTEISGLFQEMEMDTITIKGGAETKVKGGPMAFMAPLVMVMIMYMTVLLYAVAVMRAVLEEKSSRVMEVLLSSISAKEMMAGKIVGVGAVGITQIAIWVALCVPLVAPAISSGFLEGVQIPRAAIASFAIFYFLGYVLYSSMYAALGASVNSEQEAQQWQTLLMLPLILAVMVMMFVIRQPNSPLAFWASMIPFLSPVIMYARIAVQTPPLWEIGLSIVLLVATIYGMVALCGRIYRVGILMYGKRPTLPEIMKWIKYA